MILRGNAPILPGMHESGSSTEATWHALAWKRKRRKPVNVYQQRKEKREQASPRPATSSDAATDIGSTHRPILAQATQIIRV